MESVSSLTLEEFLTDSRFDRAGIGRSPIRTRLRHYLKNGANYKQGTGMYITTVAELCMCSRRDLNNVPKYIGPKAIAAVEKLLLLEGLRLSDD